MRNKLVATTVLVIALMGGTAPVGAVNGDLDGNAHPNVGVMLVQDANGDVFEFCGGVLISPTVFLTNYNCPGAVEFAQSIGGRAVITFEPVLPWPPVGSAFRTVEAGYIHPDANPNNGTNLYGIAVLARPESASWHGFCNSASRSTAPHSRGGTRRAIGQTVGTL